MLSILFAISWPGAGGAFREYPGRHELWSLVESVALTSLLYWWIGSIKRREAAERAAKVVTFPGPRAGTVVRCGLLLALSATAFAQVEAPTTPTPPTAAPEEKAEEPGKRFELHGSVDTSFVYNFNEPADHANFFPGVGTSAKRHDEITVNLAQADFVLRPEPVGFKLSLGFGNAPDVVHAAEVTGAATSRDVWRNVLQASVQWQTQVGRGLLFEAGIYPSHIGMEALAPKDNWNYTRSWLGELSPYYQAGLKIAYPFREHFGAQLHLLNGWQMTGDVNSAKSVGAQLAYSAGGFALSLNGIVGPELPDNDHDVRALVDVVTTYKIIPSLSLGLSADLAREGRPEGRHVSWGGVGLYARFAPPDSRTALAVRGEYYDDEDGAISGTPQTLKELTVTLEHRPVAALLLRLEGRYDSSSAFVFTGTERDTDGTALRTEKSQFLLILGAVASF